jgi:hypothetical protein
MDQMSTIKAILDENIKDMQTKNVEDKRGETSMPKAPENSGTPEEFKKAPGYDAVKKAGNATSQATPPHKDSKAKSSTSSSNKLTGPSAGGADVTAEESDKEDGGKESFADRMRKLRDKKKGGKKDDKKDAEPDNDSDDSEDGDDSDDKAKKKNPFAKKGMDEHFDALFGEDGTLTEDFKNRAKTVFEAALADREAALREEVQAELDEQFDNELDGIRAELAEQLDSYLDYVTEQWMEDNHLQVENGVRTEIAESLLEAMRGVFLQHNITVPESKVDVVQELASKVDELEARLNEEIAANVELSEMVEDFRKNEIIAELGEGLAATQFDRFATLCENVAFDSDEDYTKKIKVIKESYFGANKSTKKPAGAQPDSSVKVIAESVNDEPDGSTEEVVVEPEQNSFMEAYVQSLSKFGKK